uniref:Myeloid-derived growth factor n=1 Tax=Callorhinchus milii TaxID=7868 RepID=A0A4W3H156_CALMI
MWKPVTRLKSIQTKLRIPCIPPTCANSRDLEWNVDSLPGGTLLIVLYFIQDGYTCTFTYASQGGTNEQWQMSLGVNEDSKLFSCSIWRPQGKSYLFFTQFKAEVTNAKIEYAEAFSQAAGGGRSDIPLKPEEYVIGENTVAHKVGSFRSELSKLVIVAHSAHDEL